jgi:hypothetical protein
MAIRWVADLVPLVTLWATGENTSYPGRLQRQIDSSSSPAAGVLTLIGQFHAVESVLMQLIVEESICGSAMW